MSDGNLRQLANDLEAFVTRDLSFLTKYGITADTVSDLHDLKVAFIALPKDAELRSDHKYATIAKNNKKEVIANVINDIRNRAVMVFGLHSNEFNDFHFELSEEANELEFASAAEIVASAASRHLTALAAKGQTALELTELTAKIAEYTELLTAVRTAEYNRGKAKENRIVAGNALYDAMSDIALAGKSVFADVEPSKYAGYLLYPDAANTPEKSPKVNNVHYATPYLYWNEAPRAESYRVEVSLDGGATISTYENDVEDPQIDVQMPTEGVAMYRVIAINEGGESEPSDWLILVGSVGAPAGVTYDGSGFHITPVANAESYQFKYGPVGGSVDAPGTTEVFNSNTTDYGWTFPFTGTWVIYVRVQVAGVWSPWLVQEMTFA